MVAAVVALLILWTALPLTTAISSATGSRVLLPYPAEMLDYGLGVLRSVVGMAEVTLPPVVVAVVVAAIGLALRPLFARKRRSAPPA